MRSLPRKILWAQVIMQLTAGGLGFALAPAALFPQIVDAPLAALSLRLAAWTNIGQALLIALLLWRVSDPVVLRAAAAAGALYHALAGVDAWRIWSGALPITVAAPLHPLWAHLLMASALALAALTLVSDAEHTT